jgi:integrase
LPEAFRIKLRLRKPQGTSTRCWTETQIGTVLDYCRTHPQLKWLGDVILMMALTGLRISEVRDLRWTDLDIENGVFCIEDETAGRQNSGETRRTLKGGRGRSFPIHDRLLPMLETRRASSGPVFTGPLGGRLKPDLVRRKLIEKILEAIAKATEDPQSAAEFRKLRPHGLRHFFCSLCCSRNVPEQLVMRWLGHRDSEMVRHYYHVHDQEALRQMQRLNVEFPENGAGA